MQASSVASKPKQYGVHVVPEVVIDGRLMDCCWGGRAQEHTIRAVGWALLFSQS